MAVTSERSLSEGKVWSLCRMPFWHSSNADGSSSSSSSLSVHHQNQLVDQPDVHSLTLVSSVAKSFLPTRRRLSLDPPNKLYFPCTSLPLYCCVCKCFYTYIALSVFHLYDEPGKQVKSAIRIKNISKSHVAFKFQTTAPKSCYMRPPGEILAPGESLIATGNIILLDLYFLFDVAYNIYTLEYLLMN
ncbi:unnamed protein product [Ilex paraguariensis]|uniref:MSP domain-containing protein n=1 Tax=Ilex paraguariensis TaxID=185542 RepID=A0ABC8V0G6_9AQUA